MNKTRRLLLKNSFKTAFKHWTQLIGITVLVMLFATIISLLGDISKRIIDGNSELTRTSQLHDFINSQSSSYTVSITDKSLNEYLKDENPGEKEKVLNEWKKINEQGDQELNSQFLINLLSKKYDFNWTRTEGRTFNSVKLKSKSITIKTLIKTGSNSDGSATDDKLVITSGRNISSDLKNAQRQIVISPNFASKNNINIGDIIRVEKDTLGSDLKVNDDIGDRKAAFNELQDQIKNIGPSAIDDTEFSPFMWFVVCGFGQSADFAFPVVDKTTYIPDVSSQAIMYVDKSLFGMNDYKLNGNQFYSYTSTDAKLYVSSDFDKEVSFSCKFKDSKNKIANNILDRIQLDYNLVSNINLSNKSLYSLSDKDYIYKSRTATFSKIIKAYTVLSTTLLVIVAILTFITITLMTKKQIDAIRKQVGTLKALGYKKREIIDNFLAASLITSLIGTIFGYILAFPIEFIIVNTFSNYFAIQFYGWHFQYVQFIVGFVSVYIVNLLMVFISGYAILNQPALILLQGMVAKTISNFSIKIKKMYAKRGFNTKLRGAIITSSFGKIIGIVVTMFIGSLLMTLSLIAPKVLADNKKASFNGINYNSQYIYNSPIFSNPLSFYKTYDYNSENTGNKGSWGYSNDKNAAINFGLTNQKYDGLTSYPLNDDGTINFDIVLSSLVSGQQPADYYSYNISGSGRTLYNLSSFQWKNISTKYLELLNKQQYVGGGAGESLVIKSVINSIYLQWKDYEKLMAKLSDIPNEDVNKNINTANLLLWFYKIYSQGLSLKLNTNIYDNNKDEDNKFNYQNFKTNINQNDILKSIASKDIFDPIESEKLWKDLYSQINEDTGNALIYLNNKEVSSFTKSEIESLPTAGSGDTLEKLNDLLFAWLVGTVENRLGTAMLMATYSSSPYYIQQSIKSAFDKPDSNYNISFGLIPYDSNIDEIGTVLNTTFNDKINNKQNMYTYGVKRTDKLVSLNDSNGTNLMNKLYTSNSKNPIVINQTAAIKAGLKIGDKINLAYTKKNIYNKDNRKLTLDNDFNGGWFNKTAETALSNPNVSNSSKSYVDKNAYSFCDNSNLLMSSMGGYSLSQTPDTISNPADITSAYSDGDISLQTKTIPNNEYTIVGIQNSYGNSQAWIKNDLANKYMGYDKTQQWMFNNYFVPEWYSASSKKMLAYANQNILTTDDDIDEYNIFNSYIKESLSNGIEKLNNYNGNNKSCYEFLKEKAEEDLNSEKDNSSWINLWNFFNNQYPVFNYKNSESSTIIDISNGISTTQQLGDYSSIGLSGTKISKLSSNKKFSNYAQVTKIITGMAQGTIDLAYPLTTQRQILSQISDLVNMVTILFIVVSLLISIVIVMLVTNLIIYENKDFIATMKIMGYSNFYIIKIIIAIYILPLLITFTFGFLLGWLLFSKILAILALYSMWVLPLYMTWYMPFAVFGIISTIYIISFIASFGNIRIISPLVALQI
ncbi:ABC transporter permease [Spiroplasma endosymbiont of Aspidapion aeneum]|uniref:ABC transporter permease n=1 Tax=Spiroplasma endosymbiont of Aspidapion aeneum TaxID=3066276 RepID=UPI00313F1033